MRKKIKWLALIACMVASMNLLSGCGDGGDESKARVDTVTQEQTKETESASESSSAQESEPASTEEPLGQQTDEKKESHYEYNMKATSSFVKASGHDDIETYWEDFLDAVVEGRTSFRCPDVITYRYVQLELIPWYLPGANEWIQFSNKPKIKNGMASFSYSISDEERVERLEQIKTLTESVLNEVLEDDYTDFEKAMALYLYFVENFTYVDDSDSWGGIVRVLTKHYGICDEFARAYSYLLVQAGVDAGTISNHGHRWSFVKLKDHYYHVDTTWGLGSSNLSYFLMSTSQRLETTGNTVDEIYLDLAHVYEYAENGFPDEDDHFADFWIYDSQIKWNRKEKKIYVKEPSYGAGELTVHKVDYEGY